MPENKILPWTDPKLVPEKVSLKSLKIGDCCHFPFQGTPSVDSDNPENDTPIYRVTRHEKGLDLSKKKDAGRVTLESINNTEEVIVRDGEWLVVPRIIVIYVKPIKMVKKYE